MWRPEAIVLLTLSMLLLTAAPSQGVSVRSDHAQVIVGAERYRLVGARQPLTAVVTTGAEGSEIIVEVIRLGTKREPQEGAVPLSVTVGKERNVFPNRPKLVRTRAAKWAGQTGVASFPVRYPLKAKANQNQVIRVALLRPDRGGTVGVRVTVSAGAKSTLAELDKTAGGKFSFPAVDARPKTKARARRGRTGKSRGSNPATKTPKPKTKIAMAPTEDGTATSEPEDAAESGTDGEGTATGEDGSDETPGAGEDGTEVDGGANDAEGGNDRTEDSETAEGDDVDAGPSEDVSNEAKEERVEPPPPAKRGRFKVVIRNEMGTFFALQSRQLLIDGIVVHDQEGDLPYPRTIAFERDVQAGAHDVEVRLAYLGDGGILFQYVNGYTFRVNDRNRVIVPADGRLTVVISGTETGGAFAELTDKPAVRWDYER